MTACRIYAIAQQKGGVGKTTTTINLGAALVEQQKRVLCVDLDPQGALTAGLGINPLSLKQTIYDCLRTPKSDLLGVCIPTNAALDLIPANIDLAAAEIELIAEPGRERILGEKLRTAFKKYEYILIDCPPSLGLLTLNALAAATDVLIPIQTQYFALRGMDLLLQTIEKVQQRINPSLKVAGILPTMFDQRTLHSREVLEELRSVYGDQLFQTIIPHTIKLADSNMAGEPILKMLSQSPASEAYRNLAKELITHE